MVLKHILWREVYRPQTVEECILPDRLKKIFQTYVTTKKIPDLLLYGPPGVGKTTIAKALCNQVGCDYIVIPGSEESGIDTLRTKIRSYASTVSFSGGRKVIIIDEADYMNANSLQPGLRSAMEEFAKNASFIFTCNNRMRIIEPLRSRFAEIEFKLQNGEKQAMAIQLMSRLEEILKLENIIYTKPVLAALIKKYFPNYRKIIVELQKYSTNGSIDEGILGQIVDVELKELMKFIREKQFTDIKKWISKNSDHDPNAFYKQIYDALATYLKPISIPEVILVIAKYQYQHAFVADPELQMLACLVEIMLCADFA